jgi:hypothetical protein
MKNCRNENCDLIINGGKACASKKCKSYIPQFNEKDSQIYYEALVLQSIYLDRLIEKHYCHWNCNSGKDCDYCEENEKRQFNSWIKKARTKLK